MKDIVGVSIRQGTIKDNTTNGFYTHTSPNDNTPIHLTLEIFVNKGRCLKNMIAGV